MKFNFHLLAAFVFFSACSKPEANDIVDNSIAFHGMEKLNNATVEFDFRTFKLKATQGNGKFRYERKFTDSTGNVHDVLSNDGFQRFTNGKKVNLDKEQAAKYTESVNALFYFVYLPLKLNDGSVIKKYLGETTLNNKPYHKIEVSFKQEGGGKDYEDIYYYWFDKEGYSMDHFAYSTGGNRFRSVSKTHNSGGVIFQDYINYQSPEGDSVTPVIKYDSLYNAGKLRELSRIEMKNFVVK